MAARVRKAREPREVFAGFAVRFAKPGAMEPGAIAVGEEFHAKAAGGLTKRCNSPVPPTGTPCNSLLSFIGGRCPRCHFAREGHRAIHLRTGQWHGDRDEALGLVPPRAFGSIPEDEQPPISAYACPSCGDRGCFDSCHPWNPL